MDNFEIGDSFTYNKSADSSFKFTVINKNKNLCICYRLSFGMGKVNEATDKGKLYIFPAKFFKEQASNITKLPSQFSY